MSEIQITNCHTHTFTNAHVPKYYPNRLVRLLGQIPGFLRLASFILRLFGHTAADTVDRLLRFKQEGDAPQQSDILHNMMRQYPSNTRFVILPMDMGPIGHGPVAKDIRAQHDELSRMNVADDTAANVIPFASIHPKTPGAAEEVRRCIEDLHFRGLKLYPRLGFEPSDPLLMEKVYPLIASRNLPVMSHCSRGGVQGKFVSDIFADRVTAPQAFMPVMQAFPGLRVCLAHFGGVADWREYVDHGLPDRPDARDRNWQTAIRDMICSGDWPDLWTDISYTLFHFEDYIPFLRIFLTGEDDRSERLRRRVLFGSDFYMTRQEKLSERAVCFRLRNALGEELFRRIAVENPKVWLGEQAE
ncbi:amidohydrolase family protein [Rhodobacterales bacterium HKCCE3408]|nr:amidohydrolase family protein [Rhodobacterales bacterium HKCCE3408]